MQEITATCLTLHLDSEQWASFVQALEEPMPARMVELLESEPIWQKPAH